MVDIKTFAHAAIVIVAQDILCVDILIPRLVFDYSTDPNIKQGYYMYKNISGDVITLNMNAIEALREPDDMKTVIVYGFIHEILHMFQYIESKYVKDVMYHSTIEDTTDYDTINIMRDNLQLIQSRLKFKVNEVFLWGIERMLEYTNPIYTAIFNNNKYIGNSIAGALSSKLNLNYDYIRELIGNSDMVRIIFPDKRQYNIDLNYGDMEELNMLLNLVYLTDFKFIHVKLDEVNKYVNIVEFYLYEGELK